MPRKVVKQEVVEIRCDHCGKICDFDTVTVSFGYGSSLDMTPNWEFCSDMCFALHVKKIFNDNGEQRPKHACRNCGIKGRSCKTCGNDCTKAGKYPKVSYVLHLSDSDDHCELWKKGGK